MTRLYKVLSEDGLSCHGGNFEWSLPKGKRPGAWTPKRDVDPCRSGWHLARPRDLIYWIGERVWVAAFGAALYKARVYAATHARMMGYVEQLEAVARAGGSVDLPYVWRQGHKSSANNPSALFAQTAQRCACLTQIRDDHRGGQRLELLAHRLGPIVREINGDKRIPDNPFKITLADLPVFAHWQARLEAECGPWEQR